MLRALWQIPRLRDIRMVARRSPPRLPVGPRRRAKARGYMKLDASRGSLMTKVPPPVQNPKRPACRNADGALQRGHRFACRASVWTPNAGLPGRASNAVAVQRFETPALFLAPASFAHAGDAVPTSVRRWSVCRPSRFTMKAHTDGGCCKNCECKSCECKSCECKSCCACKSCPESCACKSCDCSGGRRGIEVPAGTSRVFTAGLGLLENEL